MSLYHLVLLLVLLVPLGVDTFFLFAALGLAGGHLNKQLREGAEQLAGAALVAIATALIVFKVAGHQP